MNVMNPAAIVLAPHGTSKDVDIITSSLTFVRTHLDMDVAYLSEFVGEKMVFRAVNAPGLEGMISIGQHMLVEQAYCRHIIEGRLPELIADTNDEPFTQTIEITATLPIRSHVSVPIRRADGSVYGMFCCLSREPRPSLNARDLEVMRAFASLSADQVNVKLTSDLAAQVKRAAIDDILEKQRFEIALQPILRLQNLEISKSRDTRHYVGFLQLHIVPRMCGLMMPPMSGFRSNWNFM